MRFIDAVTHITAAMMGSGMYSALKTQAREPEKHIVAAAVKIAKEIERQVAPDKGYGEEEPK